MKGFLWYLGLFLYLCGNGVSSGQVVWSTIPTTTTTTTTTTARPTTSTTTPSPTGAVPIQTYDAFISYRRAPSRALAMLIEVLLAENGINAFLDVTDLNGGFWNDQLKSAIKNSPNFILVLSKTTLDRCIGDNEFKDTLHQEIREAITLNKHVVLVFDEYDFPNKDQFSTYVQQIFNFQGVQWEHALTQGSLEKLIRYLKLSPKPAPAAKYLPYAYFGASKQGFNVL